jgi:hypothetical protein
MMRKSGKICYFAAVVLFLMILYSTSYAVDVLVDGKKVYMDTNPVSKNSTIFVPLRGIFERMNATVVYNKQKNLVTAVRGDKTIRLTPGQNHAYVNGFRSHMSQPPFIWKDRLYVPLRFLSESLGCRVGWYPPSRTVAISTNPNKDPLDEFDEKEEKEDSPFTGIKPIKRNIEGIKPIEKTEKSLDNEKKKEKQEEKDFLSF